MRKSENQNIPNDDDCVNEIWHTGMRSHLTTKEERIELIETLIASIDSIDSKTYLNNLAYLLHAYFYCMDDYEKDKYIEAFLIKEYDGPFILGEVLELIGIVFKGAPRNAKSTIVTYVKSNATICICDASAIISLCNCIRCLYDEIPISEQKNMLLLLNDIKENNKFSFVNESIELTIATMKGVI